jgi:hypothetical protein
MLHLYKKNFDNWFWHVHQKEDYRPPEQLLNYPPKGRQPGWPLKRLLDDVNAETKRGHPGLNSSWNMMMMMIVTQLSGDFVSIPQDLFPEVIPSQKCHMNISTILSGYGAMDIWHSRFMYIASLKIWWCNSSLQFTLDATSCFWWKSRRVRSIDHSGQFCKQLGPTHWAGNCLFQYSVMCRLICGVCRHATSTSAIMFCAIQDAWMTMMF